MTTKKTVMLSMNFLVDIEESPEHSTLASIEEKLLSQIKHMLEEEGLEKLPNSSFTLSESSDCGQCSACGKWVRARNWTSSFLDVIPAGIWSHTDLLCTFCYPKKRQATEHVRSEEWSSSKEESFWEPPSTKPDDWGNSGNDAW
ncbi:hypothetical protein O5O45_18750 [Hahella aquimaris]|uniref:Uncharacterized protein n=1 Tax=Hahella chejuensis (strain KCTC 2396) TaxID=349521 RepID=Q2SLX3_HAHCH|nr:MULTISPECIES: hypothetical protein [Hahella]ABC28351.1 hypothetical protein HCH_01493 [Hahella chejuensis KCTC 2396]WLQ11770.1 hypothetical protein O5O45_18750 [Hahella sp. HNIBRBA332]